jgi:hypothetical protein
MWLSGLVRKVVLPVELVVRASTGPPPHLNY